MLVVVLRNLGKHTNVHEGRFEDSPKCNLCPRVPKVVVPHKLRVERGKKCAFQLGQNSGKEFVAEVFNEFNSILDKMETKERRTKEWLMLPVSDPSSGRPSASHSDSMSTESVDPFIPVVVGDMDEVSPQST